MKKLLGFLTFGLLGTMALGQNQTNIDASSYQSLKESGQLNPNTEYQLPSIPGIGAPNFENSWTPKANGCDCYVQPDSTYTLAMQPNDDGSSVLINIPFDFCFYGQTYNSFYINNNGNITFDAPMATFSATAFPSSGPKIISPFWGDVDTRDGNGQVVYKITPTAVYINWEDVGYYSQQGDKLNTFQLILTDGSDPLIEGGNVAFCYQDMQWTTGGASQGVNGFGGVPATCGANKGDSTAYFLLARFDHEGTDFDGALGNPDGISWLDNKSFYIDVCSDDNVPPIPEGISACDTFRVCSFGDTADIAINFLSPEVDQTTSMTWTNGGLASLQEVANIAGNTGQLVLRIIGDPADAGVYDIEVTATDDFSTPGVTTIQFVIEITDTNPIESELLIDKFCDSVQVSATNGPFDTYLWSDFSTNSTATIYTGAEVGVTVSLNGCYKRLADSILIPTSPTFNLLGDTVLCGVDSAFFVLQDSSTIDSVSWGLPDISTDTLFTNWLTSGTYNLYASDSTGLCSSDSIFTVTLYGKAEIFPDTTICDQWYMTAVNTVANDLGVAWYSNDTTVNFTDTTALNPGIQVQDHGLYEVSMIDLRCMDTVTTTISFPHPVELYMNDTTICAGGTAPVWASVVNQTSLVWSNGATTNPIEGQSGQTYEVTASNECYSQTASATIFEKLCDVQAPNVLSLSSVDGNNTWYVKADGLKEFNCIILNRWGNVIYEYSDPNGSWDGKGPSGNNVAEGTYFYTLKAKTEIGEELEKHGFIQVVR